MDASFSTSLTHPAVPLWLHWIALGFVAGAIAKYLMPGRDPSGCVVTTLLGVVGALIGGLIGTGVGWGTVSADRFEPRSLALATIGAVVILLVGRVIRGLYEQSSNRTNEQSEKPSRSANEHRHRP